MTVKRVTFVLVVVLGIVWSLLPIYWLSRLAFMTPAEIALFPPPAAPRSLSLSSFLNVLGFDSIRSDGSVARASGQATQIIRGFVNSLLVASIVTVLTLLVAVPLSYIFARLQFRYKDLLLNAVLFAVALPPVAMIIPFFSMYVQLGLAGTLLGLIIVDLTLTIPFVTWMLVGYMRNLPPIERLAKVDGYGRFEALIRLILPLARNGVGVAAVVAFLFAWNEFTFALVLVNGTTANTLPTAISGFLFMVPEPANLAACIIISIIPPALVAYVLQRRMSELSLLDPLR
jgi:multiple sugar transport system permease protein